MSVRRFARPPVLDAILPPGSGPPPPRPVVIEASAGTGKTFTLEHLVADLVVRGATLEEVLVVTFTERATREMRARVRSLLGRMAHLHPTDPSVDPGPEVPAWELDASARERLHEAWLHFERATVATIHGFCQRVLADHAFRSQRPFAQTLVEPRRAFRLAFRDTLRALMATPSFERELAVALLSSHGPDRVEEAAFRWSTESGRRLPGWDRAAFDAAARGVAAIREELPRRIAGAKPAVAQRLNAALRHPSFGRALDAIGDGDTVRALGAVHEWLRIRDKSGRSLRVAIEGWLESAPALAERLGPLLAASAPPMLAFLHGVLPAVHERLRATKAERGQLDFDDMLSHVRDALHGPGGPALRRALRRQHRYALVDEFQDTDRIQWDIFRGIFLEQGRGHLFVIGDPKQAIYGFRNADVHTYQAARALLEREGSRVRLRDCYRATEALIDGYNAIFEEGFFQGTVRYEEPVRCGDPSRRALDPAGEDAAPIVLWHPVAREAPSASDLRDTLGEAIAREAKAIAEEGAIRLHEGGATRRIGYSDMHVLVRNAREADALAAALRRHGVPHAFYQQEGLFETTEADHLLALLQAIAEPDDRAARLRAWTTPFFAVPLERLGACRELDPSHPLLTTLRAWRRRAERHDPSLLPSLLEETGLARRLLFRGDERALTNYEHLIELLLAETGGPTGIEEVVSRLEAFTTGRAEPLAGGDVQRLESDREAVQLLTMHKSKGLEAAVVFVAGGFTRGGGGDAFEPVVVHDDAGEREAWMDPLPAHVVERARLEARGEDERLLYVAITRAKARVYLPYLGRVPASASARVAGRRTFEKLSGPHRWLNARLETLVLGGWAESSAVRFDVLDAAPAPKLPPARMPERVDWAAEEDERESLEPLRRSQRGFVLTSYSRMKGDEWVPPAMGDDEGDDAVVEGEHSVDLGVADASDALPGGAAMGVFVHEVLEHLDFRSLRDADPAGWIDGMRDGTLARARRHGLEDEVVEPALQLVHRAMTAPFERSPLRLPEGLAALEQKVAEMHFHFPAPERDHPPLERAVARLGEPLSVSRGIIRGVVDLVFEHEGRTYFLDWKSDRVPLGELRSHVDQSYALQAKLYTLGLARVLRLHDTAAYEERFGGLLYVFLRHGAGGFVFDRPTWDQVRAWDTELRTDRPWGYSLTGP